ncbi:hypothetical protein [Microbulbifer pacificus]|uniref:Uncharacterized protein n=1 Tax=Microbulbifer pacificus TaxID=407164 RepID=A0AAU0N2W5_9GAMM|nr:hypothetical protein [Microbulbifer pacificus]WOX06391.1 hypothetical protein R5R33_04480 [Microbulbifer pacificus]
MAITSRTLEAEFFDLAGSVRHQIQAFILFRNDDDNYHKLKKAFRGLRG